MGSIKKYPPVKLIFGFIFKDEKIYNQACLSLKRHFGRLDFQSPVLEFNYTDYYEDEFGKPLKRKFASAEKLIKPQDLYKIKIFTNKLEEKLSRHGKRLINIDPGYIDLSKLVLASTKDYYHRVYLNQGIFAELTLFYQGKTYKAVDWTYPDYRSPEYIEIFKLIRDLYVKAIK